MAELSWSHAPTRNTKASASRGERRPATATATTGAAATPSLLDTLVTAQQLIEMRERDAAFTTSSEADSDSEEALPLPARPVVPPAAPSNAAQPAAAMPRPTAAAIPVKSSVALMDLQMTKVLQEYALKRAQLVTAATPFPLGLGGVLLPLPALAALARPASVPPPAATKPTAPAASGPSSFQSVWSLSSASTPVAMGPKLLPKRSRDADPWIAKAWAIDKADKPTVKAKRCVAKRAKTDTSGAPCRPFGVHMVCMSASDAKEGGCGCRMTRGPAMEHNGVCGAVGEWHVVTQPHFNCPGGSFRPAVFVPSCGAATGCGCACHVAGSGVDSADCGCVCAWRRATSDEWVKTTTAQTANTWKDKRAERTRAVSGMGGMGGMGGVHYA